MQYCVTAVIRFTTLGSSGTSKRQNTMKCLDFIHTDILKKLFPISQIKRLNAMKVNDLIKALLITVKIDIGECLQATIDSVTRKETNSAIPASDYAVLCNKLYNTSPSVKAETFMDLYSLSLPCPLKPGETATVVKLAELNKMIMSNHPNGVYLRLLCDKVALDDKNQFHQMFQLMSLFNKAGGYEQ